MKFSFSTNAFIRHSVFEAVEKIAAAGYQGVELLADIPHLYIHTLRELDVQRLREVIQRTGMEVANINGNTVRGYYGRGSNEPFFEPCLTDPDPEVRRWRVDYTKRCVDLAKSLGCQNVSVTSGPIQPDTTPEESTDYLRESLRELIDYAEDKGIYVGLEYEPGLLIESCAELVGIIRDVGSPFLGANLDLGHSHVLGEDPLEVINSLYGKIFHIHLEDIKDRRHYHLIPGLGDMDFEYLLSLLNRRSYGGFITVELYTYPHQAEEAAQRSIEFLKGLKPHRPEKAG